MSDSDHLDTQEFSKNWIITREIILICGVLGLLFPAFKHKSWISIIVILLILNIKIFSISGLTGNNSRGTDMLPVWMAIIVAIVFIFEGLRCRSRSISFAGIYSGVIAYYSITYPFYNSSLFQLKRMDSNSTDTNIPTENVETQKQMDIIGVVLAFGVWLCVYTAFILISSKKSRSRLRRNLGYQWVSMDGRNSYIYQGVNNDIEMTNV